MKIKNAKITKTMLGREDHGIMTFMIFVEFDIGVCGIGGYALDQCDRETKTKIFSGAGMEAISKILEIADVERWEDLPGKYIRFKDNGLGSTIDEIGHVIRDDWFNLREFLVKKENDMTISELKNICELVEKQSGPDTNIRLRFVKEDGDWEFGYVADHLIYCDGELILSNRKFFRE